MKITGTVNASVNKSVVALVVEDEHGDFMEVKISWADWYDLVEWVEACREKHGPEDA